ncbi:hypothetical protein [Streptomyces sp. NPDC050263]|uniref:hypothetical protein n=1 Tax=Streptomyces sp. NPDC050263 TaxID=3155037 RepID=UPI00343A03B2
MTDVRPDDADAEGVCVLDLRPPPGRPADPAATRRTVQEQLGRARLGGYGPLRLLILDTAVGLTAHTAAYERVMGCPGRSTPQVLCVAVGDVPPAADAPVGGTGAAGAGRRLRLPTVLSTAGAAVLWVSDPSCGGPEPDRRPAGHRTAESEAAVALLVELLRPPELFDEVLEKALRCPSATAALSAHVLAYDLPAEARDRAWRAALARFAGAPAAPVAAEETGPVPEDLPRALAALLPDGATRPAERMLRPDGPVAAERDACVRALDAADTAWSDLARPLALLTGKAAAQALPRAVEDASRGLRRYRDVVARVLRESGAPGIGPAESAALLDRLGVTPPAGARLTARPERATEEELGAFTVGLLSRGLALHTVAGRLTSLSEQVATVPAAGLAARLDQRCPAELPGRVGVSHPFGFASAGLGRLAGLAALVALAGPGRWPGALLAVVPALVLLVGGALAAGRRPAPEVRGPVHQAAVPRALAVALGATGAFFLGRLLDPPLWIGVIGTAVAAAACLLMVCSDWVRAVDEWCEGTGLAVLRQGLDGVDAVLADAMRRQWWAADERTRCADSARALAVVLRRSAAEAHDSRTAHTPTAPEQPDPDAFPPRDDPGRAGRTGDGWPADTWSDEAWPEDPWSERPADEGPWDDVPRRKHPAFDQPPLAPEPPGSDADDRPPSPDAPHWLVHTTADGGPELLPTLVADLADATVDALRRFWDATGPAATAHRPADTLAEAVRGGFGTARRHLERCGVMAVPPFARPGRRRGDAMALLGSGLRPLRDALTPEAADRLRALCSTAQLPLLSRDPAAMHVIRFAPRAVRTALGTAPAPEPDDAVWMSSGRFVGAIGLTALRPGAVETVGIRVRAADDDKADSRMSHGDSGGASW